MASESPIIHDGEPRREPFKEVSKLPDEPQSDVAVEAGGMRLRERVRKIQGPQGVSLLFTYTRLDENGDVETVDGQPLITDPHEVVISPESVVRLGDAGAKDSFQTGREVAVARAVDYFKGLDGMPGTLAELLGTRV